VKRVDTGRGLRGALAIALLVAIGLLAARVAGSARLEPADFAFNNFTEVSSLDPAAVTGIPEGRMVGAIFEGLCVKHPRTLEPLPGMAKSWKSSADGLTLTFRIREDARWTNGDPVTAHDFRWSWERLLDPRTAAPNAYQLWCVRGAEAFTTEVDEDGAPRNSFDSVGIRAPAAHTLVVELDRPTPWFLDLASFFALLPVNRRSLEEARARSPEGWEVEWMRPENLVTNGPFRLVERRVNDRVRLAKNLDYWDAGSVAFRTIDVLATEHSTTGLNRYLTGEVAWIDKPPTQLIPRLLEREDFRPAPFLGTYFYRVNVTRPPLDDARVRRALALAIDRREICAKIMKAGESPLWSVVPLGIPGYAPAELVHDDAFERDCEEARRLLAEAGFGAGGRELPPIVIHYNTSDMHRDIAEVVAAGWRRSLGITTRLDNQEWKVYLAAQRALEYDVSRSVWIADYSDPTNFLDVWRSGGKNNRTGWGDARFDERLSRAAHELDPGRRRELLSEAEAILMEELPLLPIYTYVTRNVVSPRLGGFFENVRDEHPPKFWYWMDDAELAARRAARSDDRRGVEVFGPAEGQYPPRGREAVVR